MVSIAIVWINFISLVAILPYPCFSDPTRVSGRVAYISGTGDISTTNSYFDDYFKFTFRKVTSGGKVSAEQEIKNDFKHGNFVAANYDDIFQIECTHGKNSDRNGKVVWTNTEGLKFPTITRKSNAVMLSFYPHLEDHWKTITCTKMRNGKPYIKSVEIIRNVGNDRSRTEHIKETVKVTLRVEINELVLFCYFDNGKIRDSRGLTARYTVDYLEPYACTHILFAFAKINQTEQTIEPMYTTDKVDYTRILAMKQSNPSLKVILSVKDWHLINGSRLEEFARNADKFLVKHGFDGLDLFQWPLVSPSGDNTWVGKLIRDLYWQFKDNRPGPPLLLVFGIGEKRFHRDLYNIKFNLNIFQGFVDWYVVHGFKLRPRQYFVKRGMKSREDIYKQAFRNPNSTERVDHIFHFKNPPVNEKPGQIRLMENWGWTFFPISGYKDWKKFVMGTALYGWELEIQAFSNGYYMHRWRKTLYSEVCRTKGRTYVKGHKVVYNKPMNGSSTTARVYFDDPVNLHKHAAELLKRGWGGVAAWAFQYDDHREACGQCRYPLLRAIARGLDGQDSLEDTLRPDAPGPSTQAPTVKADQASGQVSGQAADHAADQSANQAADQAADQSADRAADQAPSALCINAVGRNGPDLKFTGILFLLTVTRELKKALRMLA